MPPTRPAPRWLPAPALPAPRPGDPLHPLLRGLLTQRHIAEADHETFLGPKLAQLADPLRIPGMAAAVARLLRAVDTAEPVVLFGDYDVDGVTSLTLLRETLGAYGLDAPAFLPHRIDEGYGLTRAGLERCLEEHSPRLLVALDCGTTSAGEVAWLAGQGVEVVIVDHHQPGEELPACAALVNPRLGADPSDRQLCTAGLAFKLGHALLRTRRPPTDFDLKQQLELVALATVADVCPLTLENRLLVRHGLHRLDASARPGVQALLAVSELKGRAPVASDLGFRLGPRLNASGRLASARQALDLLCATDPEAARQLAAALDERNRQRRALQAQVEAAAEAQLASLDHDPPALVLGSRDWHPGVVGIIAGKLARRYHRPAIVIGFDDAGLGKGSARGIPGLSLVDGIRACAGHLLHGGGHAAAAGLSLREDQLPAFTAAFHRWLEEQGHGRPAAPALQPDFRLDAADLDTRLVEQWNALEPFGEAFPSPLLHLSAQFPSSEPRWLRERHLKFSLAGADGEIEVLWFGARDEFPAALPPPPWDLLAEVGLNHFRGQTRLQLLVRHLRPGR